MIMGDLNGTMRSNHAAYEEVVGRYDECPSALSRNEKSILNICVDNDLIVANTFCPHKKIHQYTTISEERNEKSIIDYVLLRRRQMGQVMDVRVRRGMELGTKLKMLNGGKVASRN
ncbi:hypothetical protein ILUMI_16145, partial [Ignelater luminosus]